MPYKGCFPSKEGSGEKWISSAQGEMQVGLESMRDLRWSMARDEQNAEEAGEL
jgi:hypothetical protein